ncbi:MAG: hypothetical protein WBF79_00610 [Rhodococcus sp. (in: high G+C Gram-positive bacteria)]
MADATKTAPIAPDSEKGYVNGAGQSWQWLYDENETNPDLQWPESVRTYARMGREDAQCKSVLGAVMRPVERTVWRIRPNGADQHVVEHVARNLNLPIEGDAGAPVVARSANRFSFKRHLRDALEAVRYGHAFFEQCARYNPDSGLFDLHKLAPRKQNTLQRINVAIDGGLESIEQRAPASMSILKHEPIPVSRLVAYVHDQEPGVWTGQSLLRPAHKHWVIKDQLLRIHAIMMDRNGIGLPVYEGADGASKEDNKAGKEMAKNVRVGAYAGASTPFGAKLRLIGVEGNLPDPLPGIKYHDEQIGRAALTHFLNLGQQTGSWALGSEFANFFIMTLQTIAEYICEVANQHIIEDLVDWNWPGAQAPLLVFDEIGSQQQAVAEALKLLVDAGILFPDRALEEFIREKHGLPGKDTTPRAPAAAPASNTRRRRAASSDSQGALFDA